MNINTDFEIFPYSGASLLSFGMKIQDVENLIGPPDNISKNHLNQRVEFRSFMNVGYTAQDPASLNHIGFGRQMIGVRYRNIMLLKENESTVLKNCGSLGIRMVNGFRQVAVHCKNNGMYTARRWSPCEFPENQKNFKPSEALLSV